MRSVLAVRFDSTLRSWWRALTWFVDSVGLWTVLAVAAQMALGTWVWPLPFVLHFFEASACVWVAGFAISLALRSKSRLLLHGSLLLAWSIHCGPQVVRAFAAEPARVAGELRVLTLNAGAGCATPSRLVRALRDSDVDVVFLQELAAENARALEHAPDLPFAHRALFPLGIAGKGLLARFPLREVRLVSNDDGSNRLHAILETPSGDVTLVDIHANARVPFLGRWIGFDEQIAALAGGLLSAQLAIVAGDFNLPSTSPILKPLAAAGFRDAFDEVGVGLGLSFPVFSRYRDAPLPPLVRIDHVWVRGLECVDARLGEDAGSDHMPLRVRLVVQR